MRKYIIIAILTISASLYFCSGSNPSSVENETGGLPRVGVFGVTRHDSPVDRFRLGQLPRLMMRHRSGQTFRYRRHLLSITSPRLSSEPVEKGASGSLPAAASSATRSIQGRTSRPWHPTWPPFCLSTVSSAALASPAARSSAALLCAALPTCCFRAWATRANTPAQSPYDS